MLHEHPRACPRCGQTAELAAYIAAFGERPAYEFFTCDGCGWSAGLAVPPISPNALGGSGPLSPERSPVFR
jgi:hypothetical protein